MIQLDSAGWIAFEELLRVKRKVRLVPIATAFKALLIEEKIDANEAEDHEWAAQIEAAIECLTDAIAAIDGSTMN